MTRAKEHATALTDWDRAAELDDGGIPAKLWMSHAFALVGVGDHARAVARVRGVVNMAPHEGLFRYDAACVCSLCSAAATADGQLPEERRKELAASYAAEAVHWLERARDVGYFRDAERRAALKTDPDLKAVQSHPTFNKLLTELGP